MDVEATIEDIGRLLYKYGNICRASECVGGGSEYRAIREAVRKLADSSISEEVAVRAFNRGFEKRGRF